MKTLFIAKRAKQNRIQDKWNKECNYTRLEAEKLANQEQEKLVQDSSNLIARI